MIERDRNGDPLLPANAREFRVGNLISKWNVTGQWNNKPITSGKELDFILEQEENHIYRPVPIEEDLLEDYGLILHKGMITDAYSIDVTGITFSNSEIISLTRNSDRYGYWYVYFRQGYYTHLDSIHLNDMVILRRDLKYFHQLQNLYFDLTGKELAQINLIR